MEIRNNWFCWLRKILRKLNFVSNDSGIPMLIWLITNQRFLNKKYNKKMKKLKDYWEK